MSHAFSLKTSDLISDKKIYFFQIIKMNFFQLILKTGSFNWENKINSNLRPTLIEDYLFYSF